MSSFQNSLKIGENGNMKIVKTRTVNNRVSVNVRRTCKKQMTINFLPKKNGNIFSSIDMAFLCDLKHVFKQNIYFEKICFPSQHLIV